MSLLFFRNDRRFRIVRCFRAVLKKYHSQSNDCHKNQVIRVLFFTENFHAATSLIGLVFIGNLHKKLRP